MKTHLSNANTAIIFVLVGLFAQHMIFAFESVNLKVEKKFVSQN